MILLSLTPKEYKYLLEMVNSFEFDREDIFNKKEIKEFERVIRKVNNRIAEI